jgi:glycosyltransferase involved in cell wall biosynthesis
MKSGKKIVTGHGIDTELFKPGVEAGSGLLTVGRITPSKDQMVLVEALSLIEGRREELKTSLVGEPLLDSDRRYLEALEAAVRDKGLQGVVSFEGTVPHTRLVDRYRSARIMVNASHTGSVDKVVLEAMASGALPLTCNESFVPLFGDLADRLIFTKHDARDLAGKVEGLLNLGEAERSALSNRLRAIVKEHHNLDVLMDRLVSEMCA